MSETIKLRIGKTQNRLDLVQAYNEQLETFYCVAKHTIEEFNHAAPNT